jgi:hypothetical protein
MTGNASSIDVNFTLASLLSGWTSRGQGNAGGSFVNLSDSLQLSIAKFKCKIAFRIWPGGVNPYARLQVVQKLISHEFPEAELMLSPMLVQVATYRIMLNGAAQPSMVGLAMFGFHGLLRCVGRKYACSHRWNLLFRKSRSRT